MPSSDAWLRTSDAAKALGCSPITLKRRRDTQGGYLELGTHYRYSGDSAKASMMWNINRITEEFNKRGNRARFGDAYVS